ncbi:MAG: quinoprotein relay system zinc metallohydrolase 2 [Burkholderiales bacterium]|nr:quinoprotein relay system zinc metallohydrolase 2 [Burkholderiales bacterium]
MLPQLLQTLAISTLLAAAIAAASATTRPAAQPPPFKVTEIAEGAYVSYGVNEDISRQNLGAISNIGFIVGKKCVAVIDTGGSIAVGRALRAAVKQRTDVPICYVINSHVHQDHIFGNAAFDDSVTFVGHQKLAAAMAARGPTYLNALERDLGAAASGTRIVAPEQTVSATGGELELDLGERILELRAWPTAHTDNDLTVYDEKTGTLWLGDLLFADHIPTLDGNLKGWLAVMQQLRELPARRAVAGHGKIDHDWHTALARQQRYLNTLLNETRAAIKAGKTIQQAVDSVGAGKDSGEWSDWVLFDLFHKRNVTAAYAELEWED